MKHNRIFSTFVVLFMVFSHTLWAQELQILPKSPNDPREYASFTLPNDLQVVLISDPDTDKAAASLNVNVGSASDPQDRGGLAHMLEHMLFLGTEKYPEPGDYKGFLSSHGGDHNAYTALLDTNYFFDIDKDYLEPALDRFAQFFIAPLFTARYVTNERQVVHSEYKSKLRSDGWRIRSVQKEVFNPEHPESQFNIGNQQTLADRNQENRSIRDELIEFYQRHYSANLMTLVVLGKEPLNQLEQWVREKFSAVPNHRRTALNIEAPLFAPEQLPLRLNVTPVKNDHRVSLYFPLPPVQAHYQTKPVRYLAYLLGYEGEGSILSALRQRGLANGLWAGLGKNDPSEAGLIVSIDLSPQGVDAVDEVIALVFDYIQLIRQQGISERIYDEQRKLAEISFRFQESNEPLAIVRRLAAAMNDYPIMDLLRGPYLMTDFNPDLIQKYLQELRPDNVLITVSSQLLDTDQTDPWFDAPYKITQPSTEQLKQWSDSEIDQTLALPEPNPFIPEQLSLQQKSADDSDIPKVLSQDNGLALWQQLDIDFNVPRAEFYFTVRSPVANNNPLHAVLTELYVRMVQEQLSELTYPAYVAGLEYEIYKHIRGFTVRLSGYDEKQPVLLEAILTALQTLAVEPQRFARVKDDFQRELVSKQENPPYRKAYSAITDLLLQPSWSDEAQLTALQTVQATDLRDFTPKLLEKISVTALAYGNISVDEAKAMGQQLQQNLLQQAQAIKVERGKMLQLPPGEDFILPIASQHQDSALTLYLQAPDKSISTRVLFGLLAEWLESPFYEELRTEQKLGYIVFATVMNTLDVPGLIFVVQSPEASPQQLQQAFETFLTEQAKQLTAADFERLRASMLSRLLAKDQTLQDKASRYWIEIDRENAEFNTQQQLAAAAQTVAQVEFAQAYQNWIIGTERRPLWVLAAGIGHQQSDPGTTDPGLAEPIVIADPSAFKQNLKPFADEQ